MDIKYKDYIENKKFKNVIFYYNKVSNKIKPYYNSVLSIYILPYYKLFYFLTKNSKFELNVYQLNLLIVLSFSKLLNDNKENIEYLINEIKKQNIHEMIVMYFNILKVIYSLFRILNKSMDNKFILFNKGNLILINYLTDYIKNKNINISNFTLMDKKLKTDILSYLTI